MVLIMCFNYVQIFSMSAIEKQMLCVWVLTLMTLYTRMSPMVILCLRRCLTVSSAMQRGSPVKGMRSVVEKERLVSAGKMFQLSFGDCSKASQTEMQNIFRKTLDTSIHILHSRVLGLQLTIDLLRQKALGCTRLKPTARYITDWTT